MSKETKRGPIARGNLGFVLVALVVLFTASGYWLDRWLGTKPWLMVGGVFVGAGLGFVYTVSILFADSSGARGRKKGDDADDKGPDKGR